MVVLEAPLLVARGALERSLPRVFCSSLRGFERIVSKLRHANKLTEAQATQLTHASQDLQALSGCP